MGSNYRDELVSLVSAFLLLSELDLWPHIYDSIDSISFLEKPSTMLPMADCEFGSVIIVFSFLVGSMSTLLSFISF